MNAIKLLIITWIFLALLIGIGIGYILGVKGFGQQIFVPQGQTIQQPASNMAFPTGQPGNQFQPPQNQGGPLQQPAGQGQPLPQQGNNQLPLPSGRAPINQPK